MRKLMFSSVLAAAMLCTGANLLAQGSEPVRQAQQTLKDKGYDPGPIDGSFGTRTESAVRAYQSQHSLTADGIVGDQTWWVPAGGAGATLASLAGLVTV